MHKLKKLISELCPNGVEYKSIKRCVLNIEKINWKEHSGKLYKYIDLTSVDRDTHQILETQEIQTENAPSRAQQIVKSGDILLGTTRPMLKRFCMVPDEYDGEICSTGFCVLRPDEKYILGRWLYHIISSTEFFCHVEKFQKGASYPAISDADVKVFSIPVPPLEVQCEIVRVLDNFTELTAELTAELIAELTTRKKQYEFYRNKMLTFDTKVTRKRLGEIFDFRNGLSKGKEFFGSGTPFIRYTDVYNHRSLRKEDITALVECTSSELDKLRVSRGDVLFTRTSETAEDVGWSSVMLDDIGDCVFNGFTIKATPKTDDLLPEYCAYCFATDEFRDYVSTHCAFTTRASLTGNTIAEYKIAIPSIDVQRQITNVLSKFEAIYSDLNIGLPAEIAARKKQYEYYRDKLLIFNRVNV